MSLEWGREPDTWWKTHADMQKASSENPWYRARSLHAVRQQCSPNTILPLIFNLTVFETTWVKYSLLKKFSWSDLIFQRIFSLSKWECGGACLDLFTFSRPFIISLFHWTVMLYLHSAWIRFHHKWPAPISEKGKRLCQCIYNPVILHFCCPQTRRIIVK